jgi:DNA-directed RNA polymerase specialized sigma subunit
VIRLEALDSRAAKVIELRFFGGLTETEAVEALGISVITWRRDWDFVRSWLSSQLR